MDSAYSEQAAMLLQRTRSSPGGTCAWDKGSLPVRMLPPGPWALLHPSAPHTCQAAGHPAGELLKIPPAALSWVSLAGCQGPGTGRLGALLVLRLRLLIAFVFRGVTPYPNN